MNDNKNKAVELSDEELAKVSGGVVDHGVDDHDIFVLTDDLIASGNFLVPCTYFAYKNELYTAISGTGKMGIYQSPSGKIMLIPKQNIS